MATASGFASGAGPTVRSLDRPWLRIHRGSTWLLLGRGRCVDRLGGRLRLGLRLGLSLWFLLRKGTGDRSRRRRPGRCLRLGPRRGPIQVNRAERDHGGEQRARQERNEDEHADQRSHSPRRSGDRRSSGLSALHLRRLLPGLEPLVYGGGLRLAPWSEAPWSGASTGAKRCAICARASWSAPGK